MGQLYRCPGCGTGRRAPLRLEHDDIRRYCLSCSKKTGRLAVMVPHTAEAKARKAEKAKAARSARARAKRRQLLNLLQAWPKAMFRLRVPRANSIRSSLNASVEGVLRYATIFDALERLKPTPPFPFRVNTDWPKLDAWAATQAIDWIVGVMPRFEQLTPSAQRGIRVKLRILQTFTFWTPKDIMEFDSYVAAAFALEDLT